METILYWYAIATSVGTLCFAALLCWYAFGTVKCLRPRDEAVEAAPGTAPGGQAARDTLARPGRDLVAGNPEVRAELPGELSRGAGAHADHAGHGETGEV